jgi:membrane associated rhomboid family serine protease
MLVSAGSPDLFVVCKSCGSEVSPYITECPYCGNRLRKRAPKIDRDGRVTEKRRRRRPSAPSLPRLRRDEIPGIRAESRPYGTIALVVLGLVGCLLWRTALVHLGDIAIAGKPGSHWWRVLTAPFTYDNTGYAFATLATIAIYGWLLERRHGPIAPLALFLLGGVGGIAATAAAYPYPIALGGNGAALALVVAWVIPDLLELRRGVEVDGDLIGTAAIAAVVALMPLAVPHASWLAGGVGALAGLAVGLPLARASAR